MPSRLHFDRGSLLSGDLKQVLSLTQSDIDQNREDNNDLSYAPAAMVTGPTYIC